MPIISEKIPFYETLLRQLKDDNLSDTASSLTAELNVQPNDLIKSDHLYSLYSRHCHDPPPDSGDSAPRLRALLEGIHGPQVPPPSPGDLGAPPQRVPPPGSPRWLTAWVTGEFAMQSACLSSAISGDSRLLAVGGVGGLATVTPLVEETKRSKRKPSPEGGTTVVGHSGNVTALSFHPYKPLLVSGGEDNRILLHEISAFGVVQRVSVVRQMREVSIVNSLCVHPCGDFVLAGTSNSVLRLYDLASGRCYTCPDAGSQHQPGGINGISAASSGAAVATAGQDGVIKVWDSRTLTPVHSFSQSHRGFGVQHVSFDAGQCYLLSSGLDGVTRLWDLRTQRQVISMGGRVPRPCIANLAIFLQDQRLAAVAAVYQGGPATNLGGSTTQFYSELQVHSLLDGSVALNLGDVHGSYPVWSVNTYPDELSLVTCSDDGTTRTFRLLEA